MISRDYRAEARRKLSGKWKSAICILLATFLVFFVIGLIQGLFPKSLSQIISIATLVIEIPIMFGMTIAYVKLYNGEDVKAFDFFSIGFDNFARSWKVFFQVLLKLIVPFIVVVVAYVIMAGGLVGTAARSINLGAPVSYNVTYRGAASFGVVAIIGMIVYFVGVIWLAIESYYYKIVYLLAAENPNMEEKELVVKCKELMTNKRWKLFCLEFSFIGWAILAAFSFGIGMLWLIPYMQFASIAFYKDVAGVGDIKETVEEKPAEESAPQE